MAEGLGRMQELGEGRYHGSLVSGYDTAVTLVNSVLGSYFGPLQAIAAEFRIKSSNSMLPSPQAEEFPSSASPIPMCYMSS